MRTARILALLLSVSAVALAQNPRPTSDAMRANFSAVNQHLLEMAKDFPAEKYNFKLKPEMRSFGEVLVHVASGNVFAAKVGSGQKANWDELDPKQYQGKQAIVAMFEKSMNDAETALKKIPDADLSKSITPWIGVMEHSAEHYGLLVAYYRANGLVPPESRPKK
jgi:hypothetical protein